MHVATVCYDSKVRIWQVPDSLKPGEARLYDLINNIKPIFQISIFEKPLRTLRTINDPFDNEHLGDEVLKLVLQPK